MILQIRQKSVLFGDGNAQRVWHCSSKLSPLFGLPTAMGPTLVEGVDAGTA